jgi:hypothetical protein
VPTKMISAFLSNEFNGLDPRWPIEQQGGSEHRTALFFVRLGSWVYREACRTAALILPSFDR